MLNSHSEVALVAHVQKYSHAAIESIGILLHSSFHHLNGDSSISRLGYCKYISTSHLIQSNILTSCVLSLDELVPNIALNFPFFLGAADGSSSGNHSIVLDVSFPLSIFISSIKFIKISSYMVNLSLNLVKDQY